MRISLLIFVEAICLYVPAISFSQGKPDSLQGSLLSGFKLQPQHITTIAPGTAGFIDDADAAKGGFTTLADLPEKFASRMEQKIRNFDKKLTQSASKYLDKLMKQEKKLQKKLSATDSLGAKQLFNRSIDSLQRLKQQILSGASFNTAISLPKNYNAYLDSLGGSLSFLKGTSQYLAKGQSAIKNLNLGNDALAQLKNKLQISDEISQYVRERKQTLTGYFSTDKLKALGNKELQQISKTGYYYKQQYNEWKEAFSQPEKMESKAMGILRNLPLFKQFMAQHSELAGLLNVPENYGQTTTGLQTRDDIIKQVGQRFGTDGAAVQQMIGSGLSQARSELQKLKNKFPNLDGTADMPDFTPKNLKTKSFLKRLEYGGNFGFSPHNTILPTAADIAAQVGYKFSKKGTAGLGASFKAGLGQDINHIGFSNQGFGVRSYFDWDLTKTRLHINGGFEYNYLLALTSSNISTTDKAYIHGPWQSSALLGISKKFKIGKQTNKQVMVLYDFLHAMHFPASEAIVFRVGYTF